MRNAAATALLAAATAATLLAGPALAESVTCHGNEYGKEYTFTLAYEDGTIHADGPFGKFDLGASRAERTGDDGTGEILHVVRIDASGPAVAAMPEKAAVEACLTKKLSPEQLADADVVYVSIGSCAAEAPIVPAVPIETKVEMILMDDVEPYVTFQRTYAEPSVTGGKLSLDYMPFPKCTAN